MAEVDKTAKIIIKKTDEHSCAQIGTSSLEPDWRTGERSGHALNASRSEKAARRERPSTHSIEE